MTATYTDPEGSDKSAMATSAYKVQAVRGANKAPVFPVQDPEGEEDQSETATRSVAENTAAGQAIGDPVVAEDENGDILTYTLSGTDDDDDSFSIDRATGQLMTKGALNHEMDGGETHTVTVRATDPTGVPQAEMFDEANSDEIMVTITVTNVNEPPAVTGVAEVTFAELAGDIDGTLGDYTADDPETTGDNNDDDVTWSVAGADSSKFDVSGAGGELTFKAEPDFEAPTDANKNNVYEVTVRAADNDGNRGEMAVKVTVMNENEDGVVTLSRTLIRVGVSVTASLSDPDGSISGLTWQWYDGEVTVDDLNNNAIEDANADTYTPVTADDGNRLSARASYTDGHGADKFAVGAAGDVAVDTRNRAPVFEDQDTDTEGVQNESTTRKVGENTKALAGAVGTDDADDDAIVADNTNDNVGGVVTATDPDPNMEALIYTLGGADADKFRVRSNGQIEVGAGTKLDYETKDTYMVTVMAEDSFGESASIMVTIMVTDMDEAPDVTGDDMAEYAENGTGAVATYMAVDPESADITSWTLDGDDAGDFRISSAGVLTFKKSPDYEMKEDDDTDNTYEVTVQATDESNKVGRHKVTVEVTNVDEMGTITLSALRPESQILFTATHTDPDGPNDGEITDLKWQWAKSSSRSRNYSDIDDAIARSYKPLDVDIDSYLRVTATYTDPEGSDKSAMATSAYKVQAKRGANKAPVFPDQDADTGGDQSDTAAREVAENTAAGQAIGDPVVAEDEDGDILTYTLSGTDDDDSFSIDRATGQLMTKGALNHEMDGGETHTVTVRATDPAGVPQAEMFDEANSDEIMVTITVTNVNEPPAVTGVAEVTFAELAGDIDGTLGDYTADDPETTGDNNDDDVTWSVAGADSSKFDVSGAGGELTFKAEPDFEAPTDANKNNVYEVTVRAADNDGNRGEMAVKVTVMNENEDGVVTLSRTQIRVGVSVTASLSDPDGSISGLTWQWYDGAVVDDGLTTNAIKDANSDTYTPVTGDVGNRLSARASYTDGYGADDESAVGVAGADVAVDTRNRAPVFADQDTDTEGVQNESTTRKVGENTKALAGEADDDTAAADDETEDNVGSVITANDPDPNPELLIYTLGGADADKFRVRSNGQIEVGAGTKLDYETKDTYMVTVMAEDSFGESASIMVTIMVTDVDEVPVISVGVGGLAVTGQSAIDYAEDGTGMVATYSAAGPDAARATWSLEGDDAGDFRISSAGVLTFRTTPNYETPADADTDNVYMVTVEANDGTNTATKAVTVTVTDVDEMDEMVTGDALVDRYDANSNGTIDKGEVITAINDYLFSEGDETISKPEVIRLINLYIFS